MVNGHKVNILALLKTGIVQVRERSRKMTRIQFGPAEHRGAPDWLEVDRDNFTARAGSHPC
jgi:hypothetical protein